MSMTPSQIIEVQMGGGPQGASITGPTGPAGISYQPVSSCWHQNVALTGIQNLDGVTGVDGQRVLLIGQTNQSQNGLWLQHAGAWTRPGDFASGTTPGAWGVMVLNGGAVWGRALVALITTGVTIDTTNQSWAAITTPRIRVKARRAGAATILNNIDQFLGLDTTDINVGGNYSTATGLFTVPFTGYYFLHTATRFLGSGGILMATGMFHNATTGFPAFNGPTHWSPGNPGCGTQCTREELLTAGDTIGMHVFQNSAGNVGLDVAFNGGEANFMEIALKALV